MLKIFLDIFFEYLIYDGYSCLYSKRYFPAQVFHIFWKRRLTSQISSVLLLQTQS
ncbi:Uncharacterized protein dnm_093730 [Desulfonema magnum]|uniref:Uncharacterized protein n=1 Tax=Desulfonema magnum TaxID=45655 RepID=A0A975BXC3_9BACT|nr:Uncharacterized protein dnm_093730 [Desulfonema magnum]